MRWIFCASSGVHIDAENYGHVSFMLPCSTQVFPRNFGVMHVPKDLADVAVLSVRLLRLLFTVSGVVRTSEMGEVLEQLSTWMTS